MKIKLISKKSLEKLIAADPHQQSYSTFKYYQPIIKNLYLKRIKTGLKLLGKKKYNQMLNIGFGGGIILPELSKYAEKIFGIDKHKSVALVKEIIKNENLNNIYLQEAEATCLPFADNTFDCLWCMSVLEFILHSEKVIQEIKRVTKGGAVIILGFPVTNKITDFAYQLIGYKSQQLHQNNHQILIKQIKKYFIIERISKIPNWLPINYTLFCVLKIKK